MADDCFVIIGDNYVNTCNALFGKNSSFNEKSLYVVNRCISEERTENGRTESMTACKPYCILQKNSNSSGADAGANDYGVCIGACCSKFRSDTTAECFQFEILRECLGNATSARSALNFITDSIDNAAHEKRLSSDNKFYSFLIVDSKEAYVLETFENAWVIERITSGFRNISSCLSVSTNYVSCSKNLNEIACSHGLHEDENGKFDFRQLAGSNPSDSYVLLKEKLKTLTERGSCSFKDVLDLLRDISSGNKECTSMAAALMNDVNKNSFWFTVTSNPATSVFKPFMFLPSSEDKISPRLFTIPPSHPLHSLHSSFAAKEADESQKEISTLLSKLETEAIENIICNREIPDDEKNSMLLDAIEAELRLYAETV